MPAFSSGRRPPRLDPCAYTLCQALRELQARKKKMADAFALDEDLERIAHLHQQGIQLSQYRLWRYGCRGAAAAGVATRFEFLQPPVETQTLEETCLAGITAILETFAPAPVIERGKIDMARNILLADERIRIMVNGMMMIADQRSRLVVIKTGGRTPVIDGDDKSLLQRCGCLPDPLRRLEIDLCAITAGKHHPKPVHIVFQFRCCWSKDFGKRVVITDEDLHQLVFHHHSVNSEIVDQLIGQDASRKGGEITQTV